MQLPEDLEVQIDPSRVTVTQDGKKVMRPDILEVVTQFAQLAQLNRIRKQLERESFQGVIDPRVISATEEHGCLDLVGRWPWTPWVTCTIWNDGPDSVYFSINIAWLIEECQELKSGESAIIDMSKGDRRIERIYYQCKAGKTASLRTIGKY